MQSASEEKLATRRETKRQRGNVGNTNHTEQHWKLRTTWPNLTTKVGNPKPWTSSSSMLCPQGSRSFLASGRMEQINQARTSILKPLEAVLYILYIVGKACQLVRAEAMLHLMILIATKVTTATWPQKKH